ncbi:hypothetical protein Tco_0724337 [Tanacetum coccineum]
MMATLNSKEIKESYKSKGDDGEGLYVRGRTDSRDSQTVRRIIARYIKKDEQPSSSGSTYDDSEVMVVMSAQALLDWIMDSGCSCHMTPRLDRFFDFLECDGGSVQLGDNRECKIRGIGKSREKPAMYRLRRISLDMVSAALHISVLVTRASSIAGATPVTYRPRVFNVDSGRISIVTVNTKDWTATGSNINNSRMRQPIGMKWLDVSVRIETNFFLREIELVGIGGTTMCFVLECWTGMQDMAMADFESQ